MRSSRRFGNEPRSKNFHLALYTLRARKDISDENKTVLLTRAECITKSPRLSAALTISTMRYVFPPIVIVESDRAGPALKLVLRSFPTSSGREIARTTVIGRVRRDCDCGVQSRKKPRPWFARMRLHSAIHLQRAMIFRSWTLSVLNNSIRTRVDGKYIFEHIITDG